MEQIRADGVAPVLVCVIQGDGAVLVKQVPLAILIDQPVDVIIPAESLREMKLRAQWFGVYGLEVALSVRTFYQSEAGTGGQVGYRQNGLLADVLTHVEGGPPGDVLLG